MSRTIKRALAWGALCLVGCASAGPGLEEMNGTAAVAITNAPADGTCVRITVTGSRTVERLFDVMVGASTIFALDGLPLGSDTFKANAFGGACASVTPMSTPNWVSDPVVQVVTVAPPASVPLVMKRNGMANVSVDFPNEPDGSVADAGSPDATVTCMPPTVSCGGVCRSVQTDPVNCGSCGTVCPTPPNTGGPVCMGGMCAAGPCTPGFANCNGIAMDGCETNTINNPTNCGGCGIVCPMRPNTTGSVCAMGACGITGCVPGFANCNGNATDGCEANVQIDLNNCGACGNTCGVRPNTTGSVCAMGACTIGACTPGFANCNGAFADGCEVNLQNDVNNCGGCGQHCMMACVMGVCNP
jgi:hypothetical protein